MKIAICDSNGNHAKNLKTMLYGYCNLQKMDLLVEIFSSGEMLLKSKNEYLLIFIEYELSGINGLEVAKQLRKKGIEADIIFLSKNTDFIFDSFKVSPYRFLKKPLDNTELFNTLNDFFTLETKNYPVFISNKLDTYCINTKDILYLEANNKHCYVHLQNEVIDCNKTMARVCNVLPEKYFKKINRAFIVNLNYISKYNNEYVFLSNNMELHISRNYLQYFKKEFLNFTKPKIP